MARDWRLLREWMILAILLVLCDVITHSVLAADATGDQMTETAWWDEKDSGLVALIGTAASFLIAAGTFWWGVSNIP